MVATFTYEHCKFNSKKSECAFDCHLLAPGPLLGPFFNYWNRRGRASSAGMVCQCGHRSGMGDGGGKGPPGLRRRTPGGLPVPVARPRAAPGTVTGPRRCGGRHSAASPCRGHARHGPGPVTRTGGLRRTSGSSMPPRADASRKPGAGARTHRRGDLRLASASARASSPWPLRDRLGFGFCPKRGEPRWPRRCGATCARFPAVPRVRERALTCARCFR